MQPYDVAVINGNEEVFTHQVWAGTVDEVVGVLHIFYKDVTIIGIIFGTEG